MITPLVKKVAGVSALALAGGIFGGCLDQQTTCELLDERYGDIYQQLEAIEGADGAEAEALNALLAAELEVLDAKWILHDCGIIDE